MLVKIPPMRVLSLLAEWKLKSENVQINILASNMVLW